MSGSLSLEGEGWGPNPLSSRERGLRTPGHIHPRIKRMFAGQFFNRLFIASIQRSWNQDFDNHELIALFPGALDASLFDPELGAAAGAGRNCKRDRSIQSRNRYLCPEQRLVHAQRQLKIDVQSFAREISMGTDVGDDVEIARFAAGLFAFAFEANAAAVLHASGDFDVDGFDASAAIDLER